MPSPVTPKAEANVSRQKATEANMKIYQKELSVVVASVIVVMLIALGLFFMLPFPGLLDVYVWGFPFPYWYQMTIAWLGVIVFIYYIVSVLNKIDVEKANAEREVE